jgi:hypothetical protein
MVTATARKGWIVSARYDSIFFTGSLVLPLALWVAFQAGWMTGIAVYVTFQLAFNLPHNFQTWTMSVLDGEDRAKNARTYALAFLACVLVLGVPMVVSPDLVYPWVRDALIYWGYYHLVRQHYGFQRIYERKMGGVPARESMLYARFLDAVSYLPLLIRFRDPELMTIRAGSATTWIHHPVLPRAIWVPLLALYGAVILAAIVHHVWMAAKGRPAIWPRALLLLTVTICFGLSAILIDDMVVAIAIVTSFHNLQYLGLVWFHNKSRAEAGAIQGNPLVSWIAREKIARYVAVSLVYGVVIFLPRAVFRSDRIAELPLAAVVAFHYFVDARMWRFKDYPMRGAWLKLKG